MDRRYAFYVLEIDTSSQTALFLKHYFLDYGRSETPISWGHFLDVNIVVETRMVQVYLVGTAHFSKNSQEDVKKFVSLSQTYYTYTFSNGSLISQTVNS